MLFQNTTATTVNEEHSTRKIVDDASNDEHITTHRASHHELLAFHPDHHICSILAFIDALVVGIPTGDVMCAPLIRVYGRKIRPSEQ